MYNKHTLSEDVKFMCTRFRNRKKSKPLVCN